MAWKGFIKTYFANFNLYEHVLSIDEGIDDNKTFIVYLHKKYPINDKKQDIPVLSNQAQLENIVVGKYNRYNYYFLFLH